MPESRDDYQSAEEWAKRYHPLKHSGGIGECVGGTLFGVDGDDRGFINRMDKEFVWSVLRTEYFSYIVHGLCEEAVGCLVSDSPVMFADTTTKFAIAFDLIDWDAYEDILRAPQNAEVSTSIEDEPTDLIAGEIDLVPVGEYESTVPEDAQEDIGLEGEHAFPTTEPQQEDDVAGQMVDGEDEENLIAPEVVPDPDEGNPPKLDHCDDRSSPAAITDNSATEGVDLPSAGELEQPEETSSSSVEADAPASPESTVEIAQEDPSDFVIIADVPPVEVRMPDGEESYTEPPQEEPIGMRKLPIGLEEAKKDHDTYGPWPEAVECGSCCGNGYFAGIRMCDIDCETCDGRGWNPATGSPLEIPIYASSMGAQQMQECTSESSEVERVQPESETHTA